MHQMLLKQLFRLTLCKVWILMITRHHSHLLLSILPILPLLFIVLFMQSEMPKFILSYSFDIGFRVEPLPFISIEIYRQLLFFHLLVHLLHVEILKEI